MNEENGTEKTLVDLYGLQRNIIYDIHTAKAATRRNKLEKLLKDVKKFTKFQEEKIGLNK